mmetsp:Transcript_11930/g.31541  ORF Transcript_11930/g.31541 Transcript_11930/m.31541 type:complete len:139 (+) Transcript_11930:1072-1488(+)
MAFRSSSGPMWILSPRPFATRVPYVVLASSARSRKGTIIGFGLVIVLDIVPPGERGDRARMGDPESLGELALEGLGELREEDMEALWAFEAMARDGSGARQRRGALDESARQHATRGQTWQAAKAPPAGGPLPAPSGP